MYRGWTYAHWNSHRAHVGGLVGANVTCYLAENSYLRMQLQHLFFLMFLTWSASRPEQYISTIGGPESWNKSFYSKRKEERVKTSDDRDNWWAFDEVGVHGFFLQPPPCAPHLAESSSIISIIWCFHPFFLSFAVEALVSVLIAIPTPATLCMKEERSESCDRGCDN